MRTVARRRCTGIMHLQQVNVEQTQKFMIIKRHIIIKNDENGLVIVNKNVGGRIKGRRIIGYH